MRFPSPLSGFGGPSTGSPVSSSVFLLNAKARNPLRIDPTRTGTLRAQFASAVRARFRQLRKSLIQFIALDDSLALDPRQSFFTLNAPREFEFRTDAEKLKAFQDWFAKQVEADVLAPATTTPIGQPWVTPYVESAYRRGITNAYLSAKAQDLNLDDPIGEMTRAEFLSSAFNSPEALSKVQLLATRSFEQLKGITTTMGTEMNRILAQAIADGRGAEATARLLLGSLTSLTQNRALMLARTELIHAHAEGQLDSFTRLGVKELGIKAEWVTAGDDRVCPRCDEMQGKVFTIEEARGLIPLHPNCRCTWVPSV